MTKDIQTKATLIFTGIGTAITIVGVFSGLIWLIITLSLSSLEEKVSSVDASVKGLKQEVKEVQKQMLSRDEIDLRMDSKVDKHRIDCHTRNP